VAGLDGATALITGAGSGIGRAIALGLGGQVEVLCLVGRTLEKLEAVAAEARPSAANVRCFQADLASDANVRDLIGRLRDLKHVDVLIHSAGAIKLGGFESAAIDDLDWQYRVNVRAPYILTQALLPRLKARRGQVVFVNSSAGVSAGKNVGQYAATKHALKALADSLRAEVNAEGVRVISVYPGRTASPMQAAVHAMEGKAYRPEKLMQPEDVADVIINALTLPRTAEVMDVHIRPLAKLS